jgi:protein arginine N-methyltransferase 2
MNVDTDDSNPDKNVLTMIQACRDGNLSVIHSLLATYAAQQDTVTGMSPLMAAAELGNVALCQLLLQHGAPWNAVDRMGQCAGNYATNREHWPVVNLLVEHGTQAELILGRVIRNNHQNQQHQNDTIADNIAATIVEHEPSTKPDYLRQRLHYTPDGRALLDDDRDAVMMEWERPLMHAHAQILNCKRVLNVGFGMGIIDSFLQKQQPELHIIIEAHPDVYQRMLDEKWNARPGVRICFGKWQDEIPKLIQQGVQVDGIFYDTYGEHFMDLEDFHAQMVQLLSKPHGVYSFFNGLAPDNLFFHGVACQCVKLQLAQLGLDSDFIPCEIQVANEEWEGIRRKYWHGRDTYYLPKCTWNADYLATGRVVVPLENNKTKQNVEDTTMEFEDSSKRLRAG